MNRPQDPDPAVKSPPDKLCHRPWPVADISVWKFTAGLDHFATVRSHEKRPPNPSGERLPSWQEY